MNASTPEHQSSTAATTASKRTVMDRLRRRSYETKPVSPVDANQLTQFGDPVRAFVDSLAGVGGEAHFVENAADVLHILGEIDVFRHAKRIASNVPEIIRGNIDLTTIDDPHALATLDWSIVPGEFGVAENGAIWVDGRRMQHRVMLFIAQYLAITVSRSAIVNNMHEAYARINTPSSAGFSVFVSGPSKTADIEQSLVLGAHGCRALQVFLLP